jgi:hypothetical protein
MVPLDRNDRDTVFLCAARPGIDQASRTRSNTLDHTRQPHHRGLHLVLPDDAITERQPATLGRRAIPTRSDALQPDPGGSRRFHDRGLVKIRRQPCQDV